jgi:hypothetical protein
MIPVGILIISGECILSFCSLRFPRENAIPISIVLDNQYTIVIDVG